jgi:hypothetical protein
MSFHIAPILRERENTAIAAGLLINLDSNGYTVRKAQEGVSVPTPLVTPAGGIGYLFWGGSNLTKGTLGLQQTPTL